MCGASATARRFADDPFQLGVASGDPTPTGGVLWTRLAPRPLEPDGGMDGSASDRQLAARRRRQVCADHQAGTRGRRAGAGYSVHVDVDGLAPDRWYFYRFTAGDATSRVGRFRTAPAANATTPLRFAFVSCQHYEQGLYTAYAHLAREELDLVAHLGDYIYEYGADDGHGAQARVARDPHDLDRLSARYAQYKIGSRCSAPRTRCCPWLVDLGRSRGRQQLRRPVRRESDGVRGADADAARGGVSGVVGASAGARAARAVVGRSHDHAHVRLGSARAHSSCSTDGSIAATSSCGDGNREVPCGDWADPKRTMLGAEQERWLYDGLASVARALASARQSGDDGAVRFSSPGPGVRHSMDQWSGYPAARDRLLELDREARAEPHRRASRATSTRTG